MPVTRTALRALRKSRTRALINRPVRSKVKTAFDHVKEAKNATSLSAFFSAVDKAVKHHLIHKNKAARLKSKASKLIA